MVVNKNNYQQFNQLEPEMQNRALEYMRLTGQDIMQKSKFMFQVKDKEIQAVIFHKTLAELNDYD